MNYLNHYSPRERILHLLYVQTISISRPLGEFATWLVTGTAAIIGAVIVNVENVRSVLSVASLRWGLALLLVSLLAGVIVRNLAVALAAGIELLDQLAIELNSAQGAAAIRALSEAPEVFLKEYSSPFLPPLRGLINRGFWKGAKDPLRSQKTFARMFSIQIFAMWLQAGLGVAGLLTFAFGIN